MTSRITETTEDEARAILDMVLSEYYCARCDSAIGVRHDRPDWCDVCWNNRKRLPRRIEKVLRFAQEQVSR